jgi:tetratricopeptide (TPR) repeat protein
MALGEAYDRLYELGRYKKNLEEQMTVFRQALELDSQKTTREGPPGDLDLEPIRTEARDSILSWLAHTLQTRFTQRGASNDLDEAISLHQEALVLRPAPHPDRSTSLNNFANALQTRFEQRGASNDLDEAISLHCEALVL